MYFREAIFAASHLRQILDPSTTFTRPWKPKKPHHRAAYKHILGTSFADDKEVFFAGEDR